MTLMVYENTFGKTDLACVPKMLNDKNWHRKKHFGVFMIKMIFDSIYYSVYSHNNISNLTYDLKLKQQYKSDIC